MVFRRRGAQDKGGRLCQAMALVFNSVGLLPSFRVRPGLDLILSPKARHEPCPANEPQHDLQRTPIKRWRSSVSSIEATLPGQSSEMWTELMFPVLAWTTLGPNL